ncbi:MAG TPA: MFS transporter [Pseudonocardiaceae bacterium]|nr:MFS transporter [Pseudonocardiaceae bacterium]
MPLALVALAVCSFAIGTTEFVITGLLPDIAGDFSVTIATAGLLVSGYALGVVVGAPLVTAGIARLPRKGVLLGLLVLFVAGNGLSAAARSYSVLLTGRVVAALCHGAFLGVASVVAAGLVGPERRARAIAAMLSGLTIANVAGVPMGTFLGQHFAWRSTFLAIAGLGLLGMAGVAALVPRLPVPADAGVRAELAAFRHGQVWLALAMTALGFGAVYAPFTYIAPLLTGVAGFTPAAVPWLLVLFGAGLVIGNVLGARAADYRLLTTILVLLAVLTGLLVVFDHTAHGRISAAVTLFALGVIGFATVPAFTSRVLTTAGTTAANTMASSAAVAAFNLGNATGAYLGGRVIAAGHGYASPTLVGAAMAAAALLTAAVSAAWRPVRPAGQLDLPDGVLTVGGMDSPPSRVDRGDGDAAGASGGSGVGPAGTV